MMRAIFFLCLIYSNIAIASPFTFDIINNAIQSNNGLKLGRVDRRLCSSPGLVSMNSLGDGMDIGKCIGVSTPSYCEINLLIPVKIVMTSSEAYNVNFTRGDLGSNFTGLSLRNSRNQLVGGGIEMLGTSIAMNNQTIYAELEVTAAVCGSDTKASYSNTVDVNITPSI